jgi:hypothetical protein
VRAALLVPVLASSLLAQEAPGLSFEGFQAWMKSIAVPGYKLAECEQDGSEYTAAFMGASPQKLLMVRCGSLDSFQDVKRMPGAVQGLKEGSLDGLRTQRYAMAGMPMLVIELKGKASTLTLAGGEGMPASELDKLAAALELKKRAQ